MTKAPGTTNRVVNVTVAKNEHGVHFLHGRSGLRLIGGLCSQICRQRLQSICRVFQHYVWCNDNENVRTRDLVFFMPAAT